MHEAAKTVVNVMLPFVMGALMTSCAVEGTFVTKRAHGNLEIAVEWEGERGSADAEVLVDGKPMGHVSPHRPVLYLTEGQHIIEVRSPGYETWQKTLHIAGEPNHQYLHVRLQRKSQPSQPLAPLP